MEIRKLSDCVLRDIVKAWNRGFNGYEVQLEMTEEVFLDRLVTEGLSAEYSVVGFVDGEPIGIVVNGIRKVNGQTVAWNAGTGLAPEYRGKGYTKQLMNEVMSLYEQQQVQQAVLEAITENKVAIQLYRSYGYEIIGELIFLSGQVQLEEPLQVTSYHPDQLNHLYFYEEPRAWQCQSQSIRHAESYVFEEHNRPIGYAAFRRIWNDEGGLVRVILYQLKVLQEVYLEKIPNMLATIAEASVPVLLVNFDKNSAEAQQLIAFGYVVTTEQVLMEKNML